MAAISCSPSHKHKPTKPTNGKLLRNRAKHYFAVTDEKTFREWAAALGLTVLDRAIALLLADLTTSNYCHPETGHRFIYQLI